MENYEDFNKCYLISEETCLNNPWRGPLIAEEFKNHSAPEQTNFETNLLSHHMVYVHKDVHLNEFIVQVKNRFFSDRPDIELQDIWLYRILQSKNGGTSQRYLKLTYDPLNRYNILLLSNKPNQTTQALASQN